MGFHKTGQAEQLGIIEPEDLNKDDSEAPPADDNGESAATTDDD